MTFLAACCLQLKRQAKAILTLKMFTGVGLISNNGD